METKSPDTTIFNSAIQQHREKLATDHDAVLEEQRISKWAEENKEKIKKETNEKLADLGEVKIRRIGEKPEKNFPQDEKTEQRLEDEKKERFEREVEAMDGNYLKDLEKDLNQRRDVYASIELSDSARLAEIRKGLGSKNVEESIAIRNSREEYQKTLERFKDAKIEELKKKNLTGEPLKREMAELIRQFGFTEAFELNNARNNAKAETHMGANVVKKCWGVLEKTANAYNNLKLWQKFGISAGAVALGTAGAVGFVGAKRVLSGVVAGVGTAKGLDALHQKSMGKTADKDIEKVIEEMDKIVFKGTAEENAEKRYELMRAKLDVKLENVDERLKKQKMVSLCNKFIGITVGIFLGSGMASKAFGDVINHFHHGEHAAGLAKETAKAAGAGAVIENLNIEKGSNFSATLLKEFNDPNSEVYKHHPELKGTNPQELINRVLMDFKETHPKMGGHNPDYVLANSKIHFNPASLHAEMDEGQYGYYEDVQPKVSSEYTVVEPPAELNKPPVELNKSSAEIPKAEIKATVETVAGSTNSTGHSMADLGSPQDWNQDIIDEDKLKITELDKQYGEQAFKLQHAEDVAFADEAEKLGKLDAARKHIAEHMKTLIEGNHQQALRSLREDFFDKSAGKFKLLKEMNVSDAINNQNGASLDGLSRKAQNVIKLFAKSEELGPGKAETFEKWTRRIVALTNKSE